MSLPDIPNGAPGSVWIGVLAISSPKPELPLHPSPSPLGMTNQEDGILERLSFSWWQEASYIV